MRHKITFETFLFGGYYFESESWIDTAREEGTLRGEPNFNVLLLEEKFRKRKIFDWKKEDFELSEEENYYFHSPGTKNCCWGGSLCLVSPITANSTEERKRKVMERERERDRILVPRLRRGQRIVEQSRGSPRHPLLPSEFSIVPRVVPLAIFARLALSQIRFPLPLSLSLLVLIGYRFSSSSPGLPAERKRSNSAGNRRLHTYSQERESTRVVSSRNSIYSFFLSHCCHLDEIIPGSSD